MHGNTHSLPWVVSCTAFVTVGVDCGVDIDVVGVIEEVSVEDGVVKGVVVEDSVEEAVVDVPGVVVGDGVVESAVVEDFVEEAVVDVSGGAA